ncbi:MAG: DUF1588 domain-containing protein [Acidobacteria bacterium]|nr:DUF1588 domain-containing protein [Acidobacteriota bacterium]
MRLFFALACAAAPLAAYDFEAARGFLGTYCKACHTGKTAVGGFVLERLGDAASLTREAGKWASAVRRVHAGEMPPKGSPAPALEAREEFARWAEGALRGAACAGGVGPGPAVTRRLNREEYANTIRDLFDIHLDLASGLPGDGAGGEGFDNAAETLFLSPLHAEKYMDMAKFVTDFAGREYKPRERIFVARPGAGVTQDQAARRIFETVLPRAFRRPVAADVVAQYVALFGAARRQGLDFQGAVLFALRSALVSPQFLFRVEPANRGAEAVALDPYALASRISYFLWASMPDEFLFDLAAAGRLQEPEVLRYVVRRMLRNDRSLGFAQSFTGQWLHTRELAGEKAPDAKLFPGYAADEELRGDIRFQPILFFREVLVRDLAVLSFLDSRHTIATSNLEKHFGLKLPLNNNARKQPQWVELPEGSNRGGLLGMPAVLAVASYPYRTSPVLRGAFILDAILGTPPPPPPPNVPALEEAHNGSAPRTMRERLAQHRANPACAGCHARIDGLGFALENYDVVGAWRDQESGKPVDTRGELADGAVFEGPAGLRKVLMDRKELFVRNLVSKMLGYALGRGLSLRDSCTVDRIVERLRANGYRAQTLVEEIVLSEPFRLQSAQAESGGRVKTAP